MHWCTVEVRYDHMARNLLFQGGNTTRNAQVSSHVKYVTLDNSFVNVGFNSVKTSTCYSKNLDVSRQTETKSVEWLFCLC